jgi:hypothetical protein
MSMRKNGPISTSAFNQKILRMLDEKKRSAKELALYIGQDENVVQQRLYSSVTFDFENLVKICRFLNELPADFFFETQPEPSSVLVRELEADSANVLLRIGETQRQLIVSFKSLIEKENYAFN